MITLVVVLLGCAVSLFGGGSESTSYTPVSAEVEAYTPLIQKYAKQYGIPEYVELIKAVMMQESGGKGNVSGRLWQMLLPFSVPPLRSALWS